MKIEQTTLDTVLEVYSSRCRYLNEAELDYPETRGVFSVPETFYMRPTGHFNAVELIICYNQLSYVTFAEIGMRGLISELGKIELDQFKKYQLESSFIVGMSNVRLRKPIDSKQFRGLLRLKQITPKKDGHLLFFKTEFDFEDGKQTGEIDLAVVL